MKKKTKKLFISPFHPLTHSPINLKEGFTLVELAMVLVVIGLLVGMGMGLFGVLSKRAKHIESRETVKAVYEAIIGYAAANKRLPTDLSGLGVKNTDSYGSPLNYYLWGGNDLCTSTGTYLTVNDSSTGTTYQKTNVGFILFSNGENRCNQTGTSSPFNIPVQGQQVNPGSCPAGDNYDDVVMYSDIDKLRSQICSTFKITTETLPVGTEELVYPSTQLEATDGTPPYTWIVVGQNAGTNGCTGSNRPISSTTTGLCLSPSGTISGTPIIDGTYNFTLQVNDSDNPQRVATKSLSVTINPNKPKITTETLVTGTQNQPYGAILSATGGLTPYTWSITGLPTGLSLQNSGNCVVGSTTFNCSSSNPCVCGTPTQAGTFSISVTLDDNRYSGGARPDRRASKTLSLTINPQSTQSAPTCTLVANPSSRPTPGTFDLTWSINNGPANGTFSTPSGSCNSFTNSSGGTCTTATISTNTTFTLTVTNAQGSSQCATTVYVGTPPGPPPSCTLTASPNPVPQGQSTALSWSINNGPATATFTPQSGTCTSFSNSYGGNCQTAGISNNTTFQLSVTNSNGTGLCAVTVYTSSSPPPAPTCSLTVSPSFVPYNNTATITWTITNGPASGNFSPSSGTCTTITNSNGGSCTTAALLAPPCLRNFTLNLTGGGSCSVTAYVGQSEYRVWNNAGGVRDYIVDGFCRNNVANNGEITQTSRRLNVGETITQYQQTGNCSTPTGASLTYNQAMNADSQGNCNGQVNFSGSDR